MIALRRLEETARRPLRMQARGAHGTITVAWEVGLTPRRMARVAARAYIKAFGLRPSGWRVFMAADHLRCEYVAVRSHFGDAVRAREKRGAAQLLSFKEERMEA